MPPWLGAKSLDRLTDSQTGRLLPRRLHQRTSVIRTRPGAQRPASRGETLFCHSSAPRAMLTTPVVQTDPRPCAHPGPQPPHSARSPERRPFSSPATHHTCGVPAEALYGHPSPWDARSPSLGLAAIPSYLPPHQPRHCRQRPNSTSQDLRAPQDAVWGREEFLIFHRHISHWIQSDLQPANCEMEEHVSVDHLQPARISPPLHLVLMFSNQLFQMQEIQPVATKM